MTAAGQPLRTDRTQIKAEANSRTQGKEPRHDRHPWIRTRDRSAGLGVHSLDHFVLAVPDLAPAQRFYSDFGLDVEAAGDALGLEDRRP